VLNYLVPQCFSRKKNLRFSWFRAINDNDRI